MFGLTKKDVDVFVDVVRSILYWALDGFSPIVPDLTDEDFANAGAGEKPAYSSTEKCPMRGPDDPEEEAPAGEEPAVGSISDGPCAACKGTGTIGVYGGDGKTYSYHTIPCMNCSNYKFINCHANFDYSDSCLTSALAKLSEKEIKALEKHFYESQCKFCNGTGIIGDHLGAVLCSCQLGK